METNVLALIVVPPVSAGLGFLLKYLIERCGHRNERRLEKATTADDFVIKQCTFYK